MNTPPIEPFATQDTTSRLAIGNYANDQEASKWTAELVADRMEEAASTMRRLPSVRPKGFTSSWPEIVRDASEVQGWRDGEVRLGPPPADAITRMDQCLGWLACLEPEERKLVWARATGVPWKLVVRALGVSRTTAWSRWRMALMEIASTLNWGRGLSRQVA